jgi:hypothetical protein
MLGGRGEEGSMSQYLWSVIGSVLGKNDILNRCGIHVIMSKLVGWLLWEI